MQAVEISNSTFIVELEGSIYPNRTQEECNSMKNHVNHLICIMTPWQYLIAHYGCIQITKSLVKNVQYFHMMERSSKERREIKDLHFTFTP
jgi:hypothetical protein